MDDWLNGAQGHMVDKKKTLSLCNEMVFIDSRRSRFIKQKQKFFIFFTDLHNIP